MLLLFLIFIFTISGSCKVILYNWIYIQLIIIQCIRYVHANIWNRGVKKFCELLLVHPNIAISRMQDHRGFAICRIVYYQILNALSFIILLISRLWIISHSNLKNFLTSAAQKFKFGLEHPKHKWQTKNTRQNLKGSRPNCIRIGLFFAQGVRFWRNY